MENFFYNDQFCSDLSDLMDILDIDEDNLNELAEDWSVKVEESALEKIFPITEQFIIDAVNYHSARHDDRFPQDSETIFKSVGEAIKNGIDIDKINDAMPSLYYANGDKFTITKINLVEWCKP